MLIFHPLQYCYLFQRPVISASVQWLFGIESEELTVDQAVAKKIFDEIENDSRAGVPAEYFYYYDKSFPSPVAAAQVITMSDGTVYIAWLACDPAQIGRGHGSALLRKILSQYRSKWVFTLPSHSAVGFYEKHGFRPLDNHLFGRRAV